ncbi:MAG TPA: hypothetical protein VHM91_05800 [Verrucomicrobiales bacterium]|jgi:hypothetical protein|nr:hypothetical protein [Verrucomicrobiales bacterium]
MRFKRECDSAEMQNGKPSAAGFVTNMELPCVIYVTHLSGD